MSVLPKSKADRIQFCLEHVAPWNSHATEIGTTTAAVTDLQTKTDAAQAALLAQGAAQNVAQAATNDLNLAVDAMVIAAAEIISQIKTKAKADGDGVYSLAEIPVPATPSPKAPPGKPSNFEVALDANGAVTLSWKCQNPPAAGGTLYQLWRRIGGTGEFAYLAATGAKKFTDSTIPAGTSHVTYQIQGLRSTVAGPWSQYNVNFGMSSGGMTVSSVIEGTPSKIAA